jgi:hypothetical protein
MLTSYVPSNLPSFLNLGTSRCAPAQQPKCTVTEQYFLEKEKTTYIMLESRCTAQQKDIRSTDTVSLHCTSGPVTITNPIRLIKTLGPAQSQHAAVLPQRSAVLICSEASPHGCRCDSAVKGGEFRGTHTDTRMRGGVTRTCQPSIHLPHASRKSREAINRNTSKSARCVFGLGRTLYIVCLNFGLQE